MPDKTKGNLDKPLQLRVTAEQLELYREAAKKDERSVSSWARHRLLEAARRELNKRS